MPDGGSTQNLVLRQVPQERPRRAALGASFRAALVRRLASFLADGVAFGPGRLSAELRRDLGLPEEDPVPCPNDPLAVELRRLQR